MKLNNEQFTGLLEDLLEWVRQDDTLEGSLQYEAAGPGEWEVGAFLRFGNSMGQGGVRLLEADQPPPVPSAADGRPTAVVQFAAGSLEVEGRFEWVVAALEGRVRPDTLLTDEHGLPGLPEPGNGELYPTPASLFGFARVALDGEGLVRRLTLRRVDTGEPVWINADNVDTCVPGQGY